MSGLALWSWFPGSSPSQSLVKAPSADLIAHDTAPELPEMVEIECQLSSEELAKYMEAVGNTEYQNIRIKKERLRHLLRKLRHKEYREEEFTKFVDRLGEYIRKKGGHKKRNFSFKQKCWHYIDSETFIPPRIINKIIEIRNLAYHYDHDLEFIVVGLLKYLYNSSPYKEFYGIYFLKTRIKPSGDHHPEEFIIDAWRGPTFSDEESKI